MPSWLVSSLISSKVNVTITLETHNTKRFDFFTKKEQNIFVRIIKQDNHEHNDIVILSVFVNKWALVNTKDIKKQLIVMKHVANVYAGVF